MVGAPLESTPPILGLHATVVLVLSEECSVLCSALETIDLEHKNALVEAFGDEGFRDRQDEWKSRRHAIEEGLILREFFLVTPK